MKTIINRFGILAFVNTAFVFALSGLVLFGWLFFDGPIKTIFPGNHLSNPVTSVCFLLAAISFGLINHVEKFMRTIGKATAIIIALVALLKFIETVFSFHTGIDSWLFTKKLALNGYDGKPNLMAPNTAFTFVLTGISLALSRYQIEKRNTLADYFALAVTLIASVSLIGYLYETMEFYHAKRYIPMAFPTALSFLCISLAILLKRSEFGFFSLFTTKYQGSKTARFLVPFAILIPLVTGLLRLYGEEKGLYSRGLGIAMYAAFNILLFILVIWRSVLSINRASMALEAEVEVRRKAEQKIYENQQLLKDLYDNAPTGYYSINAEGRFVNANNTTLQWLGYTKQELLGKSIIEICTAGGKEIFGEKFRGFKDKGFVKDLELTFIRKNGTDFPVSINSSAVTNEAGEFLYSRSTIFDLTERKKTEKIIRENEKRLQTFFRAGPDAIIVLNQQNEILEWNPTATAIFGFTEEEALGRYVHELIFQRQYRDGHKNGIKQFLKTADGPIINKNVEITALHKDGHEFYVNFSISSVRIENEWIIISFISDITARKKLEEEIRQSNSFLNSILENIPLMVFVKDARSLEFIRLNKAGEKIIGHTQAQLIGKTDYDFFPQEAADLLTAKDREVLNNRTTLDINEEVIQTPHGDRWLHIKKIPLLDEDGLPAYLLGVSEDITEQKKFQLVLKESNEKFLKLFYSSPMAMIISNIEDGKIMDVNEECERLFDFRKEDLIEKTFLEAGLLSDPLLGIEIHKTVMDSNSMKNKEIVLYNARNKPINVIASIEKIRLENKDCLIYGLIDNTERKRLGEDLLEINHELDSFTYSVSHDLRTPLRIISGYAELVKESTGPELSGDPMRMLEIIITSAKQMGTLIDDLLNFSKLGRREVITHNADMNAVVQSVLEKQLIGKLNYDVTVQELPESRCDSNLIKQVWENVISNAVKYTANKPKPKIDIGIQRENGIDVYYVKDNGAGFDMNYYDRLFSVFQRLHKTSDFEGTGVGLALAQRIIAKHGGKIWAESTLNEGSTFYFTISKS